MDFFSKRIYFNGNIMRFRGLNFTSLMNYNRLFLSRESIIIDQNPWALGAGLTRPGFTSFCLDTVHRWTDRLANQFFSIKTEK